MLMNELLNERLFSLLIESAEFTNEEMQSAYGEFCIKTKQISSSEDYADIFRRLTATRIELTSIEMQYLYEQEKKCA